MGCESYLRGFEWIKAVILTYILDQFYLTMTTVTLTESLSFKVFSKTGLERSLTEKKEKNMLQVIQ